MPASSPIRIDTSTRDDSPIRQPSLAAGLPSLSSSASTSAASTSAASTSAASTSASLSNDAKERELEKKRQRIRSHPDFPLIQKRFDYLNEKELFKGFVKGGGRVREVTKWLEENYSREEYLRKQKEELERKYKEENKLRQQQREERLRLEYEALLKRKESKVETDQKRDDNKDKLGKLGKLGVQEKEKEKDRGVEKEKYEKKEKHEEVEKEKDDDDDDDDAISIAPTRKTAPAFIADEDESPVKGKARVKTSTIEPSPVKENNSSTKVEIKSKQSILNKYRNPTLRNQPTLEQFGRLASLSNINSSSPLSNNNNNINIKRRKLVRGSLLDGALSSGSESSSPVPAPLALSAKFSFHDDSIPNRSSTASPIVPAAPLDELEELERRIAENRRRAKLQKQQYNNNNNNNNNINNYSQARYGHPKHPHGSKSNVISISDEEEMVLDDDDLSDSMSEEELVMGAEDGITSIDGQIVEFLNNASIEDIVDISNVEPDVAERVISARPFNTINDIADNNFADANAPVLNRRKTVGLRMVEQTEVSLKGYKAVDSLIKKCAQYGEIVSSQMKAWGVTQTGQEGELDVVDLDPTDDGEAKTTIDVPADKRDEAAGEGDQGGGDDDGVEVKKGSSGLRYLKHEPALLSDDITLNNYQQVGLNWINMLYRNKISCILADEMGLGKTCQVISFMAHLKETGAKHPHLVVVPASTLENWIREFNKFCPSIQVQAYFGTQKEREELRYELQDAEFDVLVTTYNLACGSPQDAKFLKNQNFNVIVYDEGHLLKNSQSERYVKLMKLKGKFRLLLTGTPLQNNLKELVSLLAFILPDVFNQNKEDYVAIFRQKATKVTATNEKEETKKNYNPLLSVQAIKNAKTMMTPFVLRRRKDQVLQNLPAKCHEVCHCQMTNEQAKLYNKFLEDGRRTRQERLRRKSLSPAELAKLNKNDPVPTSSNVLMQLRKAALHPLLFRSIYDDAKLRQMAKAIMNEPAYAEANQQYIYEDMCVMSDAELNRLCVQFPHTLKKWQLPEDAFLDSGKIKTLESILKTIIVERREKVLIFSLFTQMLDILEQVLSVFKYKFVRLDGGTRVEERQETIDLFYQDDSIPVFLLSTKAGGFGINLVAANNVISYDQSFNPHDDKQAEDRAHRVGQKKEVTVYKLVSDKTIEINMMMLAQNKLQLDASMSDETSEAKIEENSASILEKIIYDDKKS